MPSFRLIAASLLLAGLAACATGGGSGHRGTFLKPGANPGEVVATELAFARMAKDKGQWTAFESFAAKDAVMFEPGPVRAKDWLRGRANPAVSVEWSPYQVWSSCDGSLAVTRGGWSQPSNGGLGAYTTVWQREDDGAYKWVLDLGETLKQPLAEPAMIKAAVGDCPERRSFGQSPQRATIAADGLSGAASDGTLSWAVTAAPGQSGALHIYLTQNGAAQEVLTSPLPALAD